MRVWSLIALPFVGNAFEYFNPDKAERFPLSGGLKDGMEVKITFTGYEESNSRLDFTTPAGAAVFTFEAKINGTDKCIVRRNADRTEDWGGFPLTTGPSSIRFLMFNGWFRTFVGDEYLPWMDWKAVTTDPITHVYVWSGFKDVDVLVTRPECKTSCSVDECSGYFGNSLCETMVNGTKMILPADQCTMREGHGLQKKCVKADITSPNGQTSCCQGTAEPFKLVAHGNTTWLSVVSDQARVDKACAALGISSCDFKAKETYKYVSLDTSKGMATVMKPGVTDTTVSIPTSILRMATVVTETFKLSQADMDAVTSIDWEQGLVTDGSANLQSKWIFLVHERGNGKAEDPWVPLIEVRWKYWKKPQSGIGHTPGIRVLVANVPNPVALNCTEVPSALGGQWKDSKGNTCAQLAEKQICTKIGEFGPGAPANGYTQNFFQYARPNDWTALTACCECGGGGYGGDKTTFPKEVQETLNVQGELDAMVI